MIMKSSCIFTVFVIITYFDSTFTHKLQRRDADKDGSCASLNIINGDYNVLGGGHIKGNPIPNLSIVNITCKAGFSLYPSDSINTCISGVWNNLPLQECRQLCAQRISTSVQVRCSLDGKDIDCTKPVAEGTVAQSRCDDFYSQINDEYPTSKCSGGTWDYPLIKCEPDCGQRIPYGATNIVGGAPVLRGDFPWHIGLYRFNAEKSTYVFLCGGSIITPKLVITAAHCVANYQNEYIDPKEYFVAAGKYYSDYDAAQDNLVQKRQVIKYEIPEEYRGFNTKYAADIAVLIVEKPFTLSSVVQPVCVDWSNKYEEGQLKPNQIGTIEGWGLPDPVKPNISETLKQLKLPYIDQVQCLNEMPAHFVSWVTPDKFCAGWRNGTGVCKGDDGGGLVFKWQENNKIKYYLRGLVSVGPASKNIQCDVYAHSVYIKISAYLPFIKKVVAENIVK